MEQKKEKSRLLEGVLKTIVFFVLLYFFVLSIEMMTNSFHLFGKGFAERIMRATSNPLVGLCIGLLCTSVVQSSGATTSTVVTMVAAGTLGMREAIPIIMGANIGTSITNTLVSIAHVTRREEFRRGFAAAMVHDLFNVMTVAVLLPIEIKFRILERLAEILQSVVSTSGGLAIFNPVKPLVSPVVRTLIFWFQHLFGEASMLPGVCLLVVALGSLFVTLACLVRFLKSIMIGRVEKMIHNVLFATPLRAFVLGLIVTAAVHSSSIATSLLVPLAAGGILTLETLFPFTLGANIGSTLTALFASLVTGVPIAVTTAFAHFSFNSLGCIIFFPLRRIPIGTARFFGNMAYRNRLWAFLYIAIVFYLVPGIIIFTLGR